MKCLLKERKDHFRMGFNLGFRVDYPGSKLCLTLSWHRTGNVVICIFKHNQLWISPWILRSSRILGITKYVATKDFQIIFKVFLGWTFPNGRLVLCGCDRETDLRMDAKSSVVATETNDFLTRRLSLTPVSRSSQVRQTLVRLSCSPSRNLMNVCLKRSSLTEFSQLSVAVT